MAGSRQSLLAWYIGSPLFVLALLRVGFLLFRQMDGPPRGPSYSIRSSPVAIDKLPSTEAGAAPLRLDLDRDEAARAASNALRDLAHEATAVGATSVALRAYDADAAVIKKDVAAARAAMGKVDAEAASVPRRQELASPLEHAKRRLDVWYALASPADAG